VQHAESPGLDQLCLVAAAAAERRGHDLGDWETPPGEEGTARRAVCRRCGSVAYVRVGQGMSGLSGDALFKRCEGVARDPAVGQ
jgi:hypothetical protein